MDTVFIRQLRLPAWIGLHRHEKVSPQTIEIDLEITISGDSVFKTGKVSDTVDYGIVVKHIRDVLAKERFGLVENLAERVAALILQDFNTRRVKVSIAKLGVVRDAKHVGVSIERSRT